MGRAGLRIGCCGRGGKRGLCIYNMYIIHLYNVCIHIYYGANDPSMCYIYIYILCIHTLILMCTGIYMNTPPVMCIYMI
jgi:hypothetical protein